MLRCGVWWLSSLQLGGLPWRRQSVSLLKKAPSFNNFWWTLLPLLICIKLEFLLPLWLAVEAREWDADPFLLSSPRLRRWNLRVCGRPGVSSRRQEGWCYLLTCGRLHVPLLLRRECFLLWGGFFFVSVFSARLLLPVAGAVSLTAGRSSSTVAVKGSPLFALSYSLGVEIISSRAPLQRRVIVIHHPRPCSGLT
jgi:hypothetical protein